MAAPLPHGEVKDYKPVTDEMLLNPPPGDWLMYAARTMHGATAP